MNCFRKIVKLKHQPSLLYSFLMMMMVQISLPLFAANLPAGWLQDYPKAQAKAVAQKKPLLAVFSAIWCGPCQIMIKNVYPQQKVIKALENVVPIYIDVDKHGDIGNRFEITHYPTFVLINPQGKELGRFTGGYDADGFLAEINKIYTIEKVDTSIAPPLTRLKWVKGDAVKMKKGSVYVVEFWATWCKPCLQTMPHLSQVQKKFKDKNVTVIGITQEAPAVVEPFVARQGEAMAYTVAVDVEGVVHEGYMTAYRQQGIPAAFIIDKNQKVVWHGHPLQDMDEVLELVVAGTFNKADFERKKKRIAQQKQLLLDKFNKYIEMVSTGEDKSKVELLGKELLQLDASAQLCNQFAWYMLNQIEKDKLDHTIITAIAKKACDLTSMKNIEYVNTYALALFKSGKVNDAIKYQKITISLSGGNAQLLGYLQKVLDQYKAALN